MRALVTGATKGIGLAIAEHFAAAGYHLVLCARTEAALHTVAADLKSRFPAAEILVQAVDVGDEKQVKKFGKWVTESDLVPDVLVNNAGYYANGSIYTEKDGLLQQMVAINLYGAYHLTRCLLPAFLRRQSGHIFNICSVASLQPVADAAAYTISKFALLGFSRQLRMELMPFQIKVTDVCPGSTYTGSWDNEDPGARQLLESADVAKMVVAAAALSPQANVDEIVIKPLQHGQ